MCIRDRNGAFYDFVPRVVMLDSTMRENNAEQKYYGNGIHNHMRTDLFIVDDVSDNMLKHKFCHALLILVYGMCMGRRYKPVSYTHLDVYKRQMQRIFLKSLRAA